MVSYSLQEAREKLLPVDGPGDWDRSRPVPPHVEPNDGEAGGGGA